MRSIAAAFAVVFLLTSCAAYHAQHAAIPAPQPAAAAASDATTAAVQPVSADFGNKPTAVKQAVLLSQLDAYKQELGSNGKYDCCVKPTCNECAINSGECHCRKSVDKSGPCCGECTQAWIEGRGNIEGVDREQVLAHLGCVRELYEKKLPEGIAPLGTPPPTTPPPDHQQ